MCDHHWEYKESDYWPIDDQGDERQIKLIIDVAFTCTRCKQHRNLQIVKEYDRRLLDFAIITVEL